MVRHSHGWIFLSFNVVKLNFLIEPYIINYKRMREGGNVILNFPIEPYIINMVRHSHGWIFIY